MPTSSMSGRDAVDAAEDFGGRSAHRPGSRDGQPATVQPPSVSTNCGGPADGRLVAAEEEAAVAAAGGCPEQLGHQVRAVDVVLEPDARSRAAQRTPVPSAKTVVGRVQHGPIARVRGREIEGMGIDEEDGPGDGRRGPRSIPQPARPPAAAWYPTTRTPRIESDAVFGDGSVAVPAAAARGHASAIGSVVSVSM